MVDAQFRFSRQKRSTWLIPSLSTVNHSWTRVQRRCQEGPEKLTPRLLCSLVPSWHLSSQDSWRWWRWQLKRQEDPILDQRGSALSSSCVNWQEREASFKQTEPVASSVPGIFCNWYTHYTLTGNPASVHHKFKSQMKLQVYGWT